ncbi:MAG: HAD family hydrolase [Streptosporangiaceae bacterium]|jgi:HAD superfamily hydrolase (TIGR01509 family)
MQPSSAESATPAASRSALQGVLFDMDGLLVDTEPLWFEAESQVMARLGGRWDAADQQQLVGGSLRRSVDYLIARALAPASRDDVAEWLVSGMRELVASQGVRMLPGAAELLAEVTAAGIPYALVTSSEREIMDAVISRIGASFPVTVCADNVLHAKPDPEPYLLAAGRLGADPACCVALEDSPNGVASAEAAGCRLIAVPSLAPVPANNGRIVVSSLSEVSLARLRGLAAAG